MRITFKKFDKQNILSKIEDFDSTQLAQYVIDGIVTIEEIQETGEVERSKIVSIKNTIKELQNKEKEAGIAKDEADLDAYMKISSSTDPGVIENWIANNPDNNYLGRAENLLADLKNKLELEKQRKIDIISNIKNKPNNYSISELKDFLNRSLIDESDLLEYLPNQVVEYLTRSKKNAFQLNLGVSPEYIPEGFTEVYFWGIPGSGKTCGLGAVLSTAYINGHLEIVEGPGYGYAQQLSNIFNSNNSQLDLLPSPTPLEKTQYLPFNLNSGKVSRSVSMIELSGEIFKCFNYKISGDSFPSEMHQKTFENIESLLSSTNRKIHFFFIDFEIENRTDDRNLRQSNYLDSAATYFQSSKIFSKATDGIYIVLTKSDLIKDKNGNELNEDEKIEFAKNYLTQQGYNSFIQTLKSKCRQHGINNGELELIPFSLGKVYFRDLCEFNPNSANKILDVLIEKIPPNKKKFFNIFNS